MAVITGRSRKDAQRHLGVVPQYLMGNHGAEGLPGWEEHEEEFRRLADEWDRQLHQMIPEWAMSVLWSKTRACRCRSTTAAREQAGGAIPCA